MPPKQLIKYGDSPDDVLKQCYSCRDRKTGTSFDLNPKKLDGFEQRCKDCIRIAKEKTVKFKAERCKDMKNNSDKMRCKKCEKIKILACFKKQANSCKYNFICKECH